jgi:hypothetical protein
VMGISRLLSSQQNSASSTGDLEGMAQHLGWSGRHGSNPGRCNVDTLHNSAHYSELSSIAFLTDSAKIGNNVHLSRALTAWTNKESKWKPHSFYQFYTRGTIIQKSLLDFQFMLCSHSRIYATATTLRTR